MGSVTVRFKVPFNCKAVVRLPDGGGEEFEIYAGVYEKSYFPNKDYRYVYDGSSRLEDLADNDEALEIIKEKLPNAYDIIIGGTLEDKNTTLDELKFQGFRGFEYNKVEEVIDDVKKVILKEFK